MRVQIGFSYPGGKQLLSPEIIKLLPKSGRTFIDVFAGRANIALCAMQAGYEFDEWVLNDIRTYKFLQAIRTHGDRVVVPVRHEIDQHELASRVAQDDPEALLLEPYATFNGGGCAAGGSKTVGGRRSPQSYEYVLRGAHKLFTDRNVKITNIDWLDCLKLEQLDSDCVVVFDVPYIESHVVSYSKEDICPDEIVDYLKTAPHPWVLCEYEQPLYAQAFGEPLFRKTVQVKSCNVATDPQHRAECLWAGSGKVTSTVTVTVEPVPDNRTDIYYQNLTLDQLLEEIKKAVAAISYRRVQMQKELRLRLLPALLELKKRTYHQRPGFYETLKKMGFNPDTVRQWFYRSHTADEVIDLIEEKQSEPSPAERDRLNGDSSDTDDLLLEHADKLARAVLEDKITYAKRLANEYMNAREESHE